MGVNAVDSSILPACAVTRVAAKWEQEKANETSVTVDTGDDVDHASPSQTIRWPWKMVLKNTLSMKQQHLIQEQQYVVELS